MLGSSAFRMSVTPGGALAGPWVKNSLWSTARAVPSLDLRFADTKSLTDAVTGQSLVTFTRASSGTSVGSDGVLKTATTNLLLQSEDFGTTWTRLAGLQFTANQTMAPNGLTTADLLAGDGTQIGYVEQPTSSSNQFVSGLSYTFSVYLKKANTSTVLTLLYGLTFNSGGSNPIATWNLDTGVPSFSNGCTGSMTAVGNGWYRCVVTDTATATETRNQQWLRMPVNAGDVYAWGAQLEQSSTVGEYIPTTSTINSAPRFDHNPTTGESLGLLVEEQRTNEIRNSNSMSAVVTGSPGTLPTNWSAQGNANGWTREIVGSGSLGSLNYVDIRFYGTPTSTQFTMVFQPQGTVSAANGQAWAASVYHQLVGGSLGNVVGYPAANLWNSTLAYLGGLGLPGSIVPSATLQRYTGSATISTAGTAFINWGITFVCTAGNTYDFTIRFAGPQLELGAFSTSFIPTTGTAATRSADVASITGSNFGTTRTNLLVRSEELDNASWVKLNNVTVTANATTAPNGFITADKIVEPASSADKPIVQSVTLIANTTYTASVYFKAAERPTILFHVRKSDYSTRFGGFFNTSTNVFTADTSGGGVLDSFTFTNVGGNWYRCSITGNIGANTAGIVTVYLANSSNNLNYTGDGTSGLFLWGAQLEVGAAVTPYIQSPSVFVSRASSGTYTGGNGVLQTATTNLLLRSEEFNDGVWGPVAGTVSANVDTSPSGTLTADKLIAANGGPAGQIAQGLTITSGATVTGSVYAKAGGFDRFELVLLSNNNTTPYGRSTFNPNTGAITTAAFTQNGGTNASSTVQVLANGWYRFSVTVTYPAVTAAGMRLVVTNSDAANGDGVKGVFLWGAQLEQSSTVGEYIPTTSTINSAARYDHDPISLIGKGLLLEEQRTNLLVRSEEFDSASWALNEATITANQIVAPNGSTTADLYTTSANTGVEHYVLQTFTAAASTTYTASVYIKAGTSSTCDLQYRVAGAWAGGNVLVNFNLSSEVATINSGTATASITPVGNGWFRCRITATSSVAGGSPQFRVATGDGGGTFYLWGAQLEAGAFPTSYIPTTTATVTRAADVSTSVATSVFENSWYRQDEGTVFWNGVVNGQGTEPGLLGLINAGQTDFLRISRLFNKPRALIYSGNVSQADLFTVNELTLGQAGKFAVSMQTNNVNTCLNGQSIVSDTSVTMPVVDRMTIGTGVFLTQLNGTIRRLTYWPQRLPNSTIQAITQ